MFVTLKKAAEALRDGAKLMVEFATLGEYTYLAADNNCPFNQAAPLDQRRAGGVKSSRSGHNTRSRIAALLPAYTPPAGVSKCRISHTTRSFACSLLSSGPDCIADYEGLNGYHQDTLDRLPNRSRDSKPDLLIGPLSPQTNH